MCQGGGFSSFAGAEEELGSYAGGEVGHCRKERRGIDEWVVLDSVHGWELR